MKRQHLIPCLLATGVLSAMPLHAQISLTTAVDLAMKVSPRIKMAKDDLDKAAATLEGTHDVYIPSVSAGAALGQAYGYSPYPPTLLTAEAQSLVYNPSQPYYTKSARAGLQAAQLGLQDARDAVSEDVALCYVSLLKDSEREAGLREEQKLSRHLVEIVQDRLDAGRDTAIDLTQAKLNLANLNLNLIRAEDDTLNDQAHLAMLTGLPPAALTAEDSFPAITFPENFRPNEATLTAGIRGSFASAEAKRLQARGDLKFLYRPDVRLVVQYQRYATFTDAFKNLKMQYGAISSDDYVFGVQVTLPLFDKFRQAKGRETVADAKHAEHDAENSRALSLESQNKIARSIRELNARMEVATLDQQLSQQQLEAILLELSRPPLPGRPELTPKDEANSRIGERERHLTLVETTFQLRQLEINLLRQTGGLEDWLRTAVRNFATPTVRP